ncbi:hypothetical protein SBA5_1140005 [Candidatus Sulfotelmatomonas gaucii]|uniref:Uncharacterized protein n=1 Tax=Candidatus Sulfuritelmatomonas gaucii TaxID=2043161 RepID=A0A2N9L402_9BACT|nr:hypothetical protein SBA5_1140005 [Candidatus Sulfotelmatomonas gaucii]
MYSFLQGYLIIRVFVKLGTKGSYPAALATPTASIAAAW